MPEEDCDLAERTVACEGLGGQGDMHGKCCSLQKCFPDTPFGFYEMCKSNATCAYVYTNECQVAAKWTCDSSAMFVEDTMAAPGCSASSQPGDTCGVPDRRNLVQQNFGECWVVNATGSDPQMKCGSCISEGWGAWSAWTECSEPCGDVIGQQVRSRSNSKGHGDHTESVPCSVAVLCPTHTWSTTVLALPGESVSSKDLELRTAFANTLGISEESVSLTFTEGDSVTLTFATTDSSITADLFVLFEASVESAVSSAWLGLGPLGGH